MGNWHISIEGRGQHHNKLDGNDANRLAAGFVQVLNDHGHLVKKATITHGSVDDISAGKAYNETRDELEKVSAS